MNIEDDYLGLMDDSGEPKEDVKVPGEHLTIGEVLCYTALW